MSFSQQDREYMQLALSLAQQGQYTTSPNPSVGCVIVKDQQIVGKGFHFKAGQPHAEVMALREASEQARGATAYVTLEPCSHFGRTPPCANGLIDSGIRRVVCAMQDPNPQVAGKGLAKLAEAGIESAVGLLAEKAEQLNQAFLHRMRTGKPFVQLKMAMSLDGKTALANGESKWITGELSRADVQQYRAKASAILSTSNTVLADNPSLNVRWSQLPEQVKATYLEQHLRQPVRVILDYQHRLTPDLTLFQLPSPIWLVSDRPRDLSDFPDHCEHIQLSQKQNLSELLTALGERQINGLWIEAGAKLAGSFIQQQLVDQLILYMAPKLLGHQARDLCQLPPFASLAEVPQWQLLSTEQMGDDVKLVYVRKGAQ